MSLMALRLVQLVNGKVFLTDGFGRYSGPLYKDDFRDHETGEINLEKYGLVYLFNHHRKTRLEVEPEGMIELARQTVSLDTLWIERAMFQYAFKLDGQRYFYDLDLWWRVLADPDWSAGRQAYVDADDLPPDQPPPDGNGIVFQVYPLAVEALSDDRTLHDNLVAMMALDLFEASSAQIQAHIGSLELKEIARQALRAMEDNVKEV